VDRAIYSIIDSHACKYQEVPKLAIVLHEVNNSKLSEDDKVRAGKLAKTIFTIEPETDQKYILEKAEEFCRAKAVYNAIMRSIAVYDGTEKTLTANAIPDLMRDAVSICFDTSVGMDFIDDAFARFTYYTSPESKIPFGSLEMFNKMTNGGVPRKTLNLLMAGVNVGKTMALCHLAAMYAIQGLNVLYLSMEMREEAIFQRTDANMLDISMDDIEKVTKDVFMGRLQKVREKGMGKLKVKSFPPGKASAAHFDATLNELKLKQGFKPDVIIVDYLGIVASSTIKAGSANSYTILKAVAEELRALAIEHDVVLWSAGQLNRCCASTTIVTTDEGDVQIGTLVKGDLVKGLDGFRQVQDVFHDVQEAYEITLECGKKIICSANHLFPVGDKFISLDSGLTVGQSLIIN
jgi:archaellum biogenesis ATPase FlaH